MENSRGIPQEIKTRTIIQSRNSKENKNVNLKRYIGSIIYNSQNMETT